MKIKQPKTPSDTFDVQFPDKPFDVVGFGTNSVDHLCVVPKFPSAESKTDILRYEKLPGGQVATALAFLSRMGRKCRYVGKVGGDDLGRFSLECLESDGIDIASVRVAQNELNQFAVILIEKESGERTVLSQRGTGLNFRPSELRRDEICAGRILHLDGYDMEASLAAAEWCREEGIPVSIDLDKAFPNCHELIPKIDFLIVSSNFPVDFTGIEDPRQAAQELGEFYSGCLVVTLGREGAMARIGNSWVRFAGLKVTPVDTTGAGDIFHGGFLFGVLHNWPVERIMRFANTAAGLSCCHVGARSGIRPLPEILQRV